MYAVALRTSSRLGPELLAQLVAFCRAAAAFGALGLFNLFTAVSADAACQMLGNNLICACDGSTVTEKLCRGTANVCNDPALVTFNPATASNSPQDNIDFIVPVGGATISYTITSPQVNIANATQENGDGDIDPGNNLFSVIPGGASQVLNFTAPAGTFSQQIMLDNTSGGAGTKFRFVTYQFACRANVAGNTGTIVVVKNTTGGDDTFTYNSDIPTGSPSFTITTTGGTGSRTFAAIPTGTYSLSEVVPAGWTFNDLQCTGGGANTTTNGANATIGLDAGETVTCTYSNTRQTGSITVNKVALGGNGNFSFNLTGPNTNQNFQLMNGGQQSFPNLPTGQFSITETSLPAGWTLQNASCGQGTKSGNTITVTLDPNETITCTFTNFKEKDDRMEEVTKAFIYRRVDNLLTHDPDRGRLLRRLEGQQADPSLKDAGPFKLSSEPGVFQPPLGSLGIDRFRFGSGVSQFGFGQPEIGQLEIGQSDWEMYQRGDTGRLSAFSALGVSTNFATDFRFAASLSDLQAKAQAAEDQKVQHRLQDAGLGYYDQPYSRPRNALRPGLDIWAEGHLSFYEDGTGGLSRDGRFGIVYLGADVPLSKSVLFGALVQFDWTEEKLDDPALSGKVQGNGWMAGPYIGVKLAPSLLFDARVAWGTSQNDITLTDALAGTRTGSFDTTRWLATATLTGNYQQGPWRLSPQAGLAYGNEKNDAFTNSLGQVVSGNDVSIGRFTVGSEVGYRIVLRDGTLMEPHIGLTGIWNFHSDDLVINGVLVTPNRTRAKLEGGVILRSPSGPSVRAAVSYDGIGDGDLTAVTGKLWVNVPFK
jgi:outer membrane autotransporter protein